MAVSISEPVQTGARTFRVEYSTDLGAGTLFYIYQEGQLIATTYLTAWDFTVQPGDSINIQILDSATDVIEPVYPGRVTLGWEAGEAVDYYLIEEYVDAAWVTRARVDESGHGYYTWLSRYLEDCTTYEFRVTAYGTNGVAGTPRTTFTGLMVRQPDMPTNAITYDAGTGRITVAA